MNKIKYFFAALTRRWDVFAVLILCLSAFFISGVWLINSAATWRFLQIERQLERGESVSSDVLFSALEEGRNLDKTLIPGRHMHIPSFIGMRLARSQDICRSTDEDTMQQGIESGRSALARDPADAHAWARYAYSRNFFEGPSREALDALRMSVYTGPAYPDMIYWRLALAVQNQEYWDADTVGWVRRQILQGWRADPERLVQEASQHGFLPLARIILSSDSQEFSRLENIITDMGL